MSGDTNKLNRACEERGINPDVLRGKVCPYCKRDTEYVDSKVIYSGSSYGMVYLCRPCDAYVGVHHGDSGRSKGSVAKKALREWRKQAHAVFDPIALEKRPGWSRSKAYKWLAEKMELPVPITHIGMFSINNCKRVIQICNEHQSRGNSESN